MKANENALTFKLGKVFAEGGRYFPSYVQIGLHGLGCGLEACHSHHNPPTTLLASHHAIPPPLPSYSKDSQITHKFRIRIRSPELVHRHASSTAPHPLHAW